jgi:25S rRNA (uracil2634-N3)-methyltransferase
LLTGNFSFAHSLLLLEPPVVTPNLIIATSYDSEATALEKYPDLMEHVNFIRRRGGAVIFNVDATDLKKCKDIKQTTPFDKVVFNFPHIGSGITDQGRNVRANQTLLLNFFRSVAPFLRKGTSNAPIYSGKGKLKSLKSNKRRRNSSKDSDDDEDEPKPDPDDNEIDNSDVESELQVEKVKSDTHHFAFQEKSTSSGTILLTLRTALPYSLWCAPHLGTRGKTLAPSILPRPLPTTPQPTYAVVRSFEFHPEDYPVYEHRRTIGYKEGVSSGKNEDLALTARERGEKRRVEKEGLERAEKEHRQRKELGTRGGVKGGAIRTWEFELVPEIDVDDAYD